MTPPATDQISAPRIAFIDVDGTILDHGATIAPSTIEAIRTARANGHLVYLCTGRAAGDINPAVLEIGFDGAVTNGGAFATRGDEQLFAHTMPRPDVDRMVAYFEDNAIGYFLQSNDAVYANDVIGRFVTEFFEKRRAHHREALRELGLDEDAEPLPMIEYRPMSEADLDAIVKSTFVSERADTLDDAKAHLGDRYHVIPGSIPLPGGSNGEIGVAGLTKGSAILEVLDVLGMDAAAAVGIGDSWNDVEMFQVVGTAFAMADADPELQRIAGNVTTGVLDDGVRNALASAGMI